MKGSAKMPFKIKVRLMELGKKQIDLIPELQKKLGTSISSPELSVALSGVSQSPKSMNIVSAANEIISAWEQGKTS